MKRMLFLAATCCAAFGLQAQQGFKLGGHASLPITSETNDAISLAVGLDVGYLFALGEVVDLGAMVGYIHGFAEKYENQGADLPDVQFIPLAASFRIWPSNSFSFGADAGYAIGINDGNDGGIYYKPIMGYLFGTQTEINLSYTGIRVDSSPWSTVNLGILYTFPENRFH